MRLHLSRKRVAWQVLHRLCWHRILAMTPLRRFIPNWSNNPSLRWSSCLKGYLRRLMRLCGLLTSTPALPLVLCFGVGNSLAMHFARGSPVTSNRDVNGIDLFVDSAPKQVSLRIANLNIRHGCISLNQLQIFKQCKHSLRLLVCLCQHGSGCLLDNLCCG